MPLLAPADFLTRLADATGGARARSLHDPEELRALEIDYEPWVRALFPRQMRHPFVDRHHEFWRWLWRIEPGVSPTPFIAIWGRGGGKSSTAETGVVALGARGRRRYALYVSGTQEQADKHTGAVAALLGSPGVEWYYPDMAKPAVTKTGALKGWRRDQLRTHGGFTLEGIGLDVAARGFKIDDQRPDVIIMDDIDARHDSPHVRQKKISTLSESILPTGSTDVAVLFIQNKVYGQSIAASFAGGTNTFLIDHILSGPFPAVRDLAVESREIADEDGRIRRRYFIVGGEATWPGQDLDTCETQINTWGITAFRGEAQHEDVDLPGGMFSHLEYVHVARAQLPDFVRTAVWVDPAVSNTDESDCMAISAAGLDYNDHITALHSWEARTTPEDAIERAILVAVEWGAPSVGIEADQGGDTWESVYWRAVESLTAKLAERGQELPYLPGYRTAKASGYGSKVNRASQMLADYERGGISHLLGTHDIRERALFRFPKFKPFDLTDASFWSWADLRGMVPDDGEGPGVMLSGVTAGWFGGGGSVVNDHTNGYHNGNGNGHGGNGYHNGDGDEFADYREYR